MGKHEKEKSSMFSKTLLFLSGLIIGVLLMFFIPKLIEFLSGEDVEQSMKPMQSMKSMQPMQSMKPMQPMQQMQPMQMPVQANQANLKLAGGRRLFKNRY